LKKLTSLLTLFLLSLHSLSVKGQYTFTRYTPASGLLTYQTNTVVQDNEGFIWIGTTNGLQRFDGKEYKSFQMGNSGLPSNPIWELLIDKKNNLWVLLADGKIGIFDTKRFIFNEVKTHFRKAISPVTYLKHLITDHFGNLFYLMGNSEVITYNPQANEFSYRYNFIPFKARWGIVDFVHQPNTKKYWVSLSNGGLAVYNLKTKRWNEPNHNPDHEILIDQLNQKEVYGKLFFDSRKRFWYINPDTSPIIGCYDITHRQPILSHYSFKDVLKGNYDIFGFKEQINGNIWVKGQLVLAAFNEDTHQFEMMPNGFTNEKSIAYERVRTIYEDRENNLWVTTNNNGIFRFNPSHEFFTNVHHLNRQSGLRGTGRVHSFVPTKEKTLLVGTWGDGLFEYDRNMKPIPLSIKGIPQNSNFNVWAMCASADSNTIWMGTNGGIYAINQQQKSSKWIAFNELPNEPIKQIIEDRSGNLWIGTESKGIFRVSPHENFKICFFDAIPKYSINKLTRDSKGNIWAATPENGAYVFNPASGKIVRNLTHEEKGGKLLPEKGVSTFLQYNDSLMIILTATRVVCYNILLNRSRTIGSPGRISGFNTAIEKDKTGYLWLTSTNGLYKINLAKIIFSTFNRNDGLENENFSQSASYHLPDGRLLFGTVNQFVVFNPTLIHSNITPPKVRITDFKVLNKSLQIDSLLQLKEIELEHNENSILIKLSTLLYNSAYIIKYKLEDIDKDWRITDNEAIYNYLPPGRYHFIIKTVDEEGNEAKQSTELIIKINPPFYQTWWFYITMVVLAAAIIFWLDNERMKRKDAIVKMRNNIADSLHQDISTVLNNINVLSEIARIKTDLDPVKSKEFIEQIHDKSGSMIVAMDDMLWSINPANDTMQKVVERLQEFVEGLNQENNTKISIEVEEKVKALQLDMRVRHELLILFKEGIQYLVYTEAEICRIRLKVVLSVLDFSIEFFSSNLNRQSIKCVFESKEFIQMLDGLNAYLDIQHQEKHSVVQIKIAL
jgi:ligand-binding sensor domain-containing protein/signal transduction histidine kinase